MDIQTLLRRYQIRFALVLLCATCTPPPSPILAQTDARQPGPLFADDDPLALTISMDFEAVLDDRAEEQDDKPAMLFETGADGETSHGIGIRARGYYRLKFLDCDVPPLRLNFDKDEVAGTVFEGQDKLKLVTHCQNGSERYQQYVFQEYLIYRAYNLLTEASFRTRLARITYVDSRSRHEAVTGYGFLIEDEDRMAERNAADIIGSEVTIYPSATDQNLMTLLSIFQFMIGNTDFTVSTHHNVRLMLVDSTRRIIAVPYDFDWAGLVDTPYAKPFPELNIRSVRERRFMGLCRTEEEFADVLSRFIALEQPILTLFGDFEYLDERSASRSVEYLADFFKIAKDPQRVRREFDATCL